MNTKDLVVGSRLFCIFKGDPGTGKSIAAASFPDPYIIDNDRRIASVKAYWGPRGRDFEYDQLDTPLQCNRKLEELYLSCPFKTVIYDGITTGSRQMLKIAKDLRGISEEGKREKVNRRIAGGTELSQIEDYQVETTWFEIIINNLKAISLKHNIHVIVTAHVLTTESTDIKTKITTTSRTLLTGGKKVAAALPVDFDEAYHFDVQPSFSGEMPRYTIVTHNTGWDWAKTALPIPLRIDFTDASLYDKIMEEVKKGHGEEKIRQEMQSF